MTKDLSGNVVYLTPVSRRVQEGVCTYANRLVATSSNIDNINLYRTRRTQKFVDLCKFHLSLLVDLPLDFNEYNPDSTTSLDGTFKHRRYRSWAKFSQGNKYEVLKNGGLSFHCFYFDLIPLLTLTFSFLDWLEEQVDIYDNVMALMNHLSIGDSKFLIYHSLRRLINLGFHFEIEY